MCPINTMFRWSLCVSTKVSSERTRLRDRELDELNCLDNRGHNGRVWLPGPPPPLKSLLRQLSESNALPCRVSITDCKHAHLRICRTNCVGSMQNVCRLYTPPGILCHELLICSHDCPFIHIWHWNVYCWLLHLQFLHLLCHSCINITCAGMHHSGYRGMHNACQAWFQRTLANARNSAKTSETYRRHLQQSQRHSRRKFQAQQAWAHPCP